MAPKSILKKPKPSTSTTIPQSEPPPSSDHLKDRHLATALHHANLIQQQKNIEKLILDTSLRLLDLPSSPTADPAYPAPEDAEEFIEKIAYFRPQDYDDLIEERNASALCGYVLCPRPHVKLQGDAKIKLVLSKDAGLKSVPKKDYERWCSSGCARKALYIKVQLVEEPAWSTPAGRSFKIELMADTPRNIPSLPFRLKPIENSISKNSTNRESVEDAISRPVSGSDADGSLLTTTIVENRVIKGVTAPSLDDTHTESHNAIEGYKPTNIAQEAKTRAVDGDVDEQDVDNDWDE